MKKTLKGIFYYTINYLKLKKLGNIKNFSVTVNDCKLEVIPGDLGISAELLLFNTHEPVATQLFLKFVKPGFTCIDIGSNIGYYACLESKIVGKDGKVFSIEPSPLNYKYLEKNLKNLNTENFEIFNFAFGDKDGEVKFAVSDRSNWSRIVKDDEPTDLINDNIKIITVPIKTIDTFVSENKIEKIDLIRMDVEGFELSIYDGMKETIKKFKPLLQIEIHNLIIGNKKTVQFLQSLKSDDYQTKFYLEKDMDLPIIGSLEDVKTTNIDQLIKLAEDDTLPYTFHVFLE